MFASGSRSQDSTAGNSGRAPSAADTTAADGGHGKLCSLEIVLGTGFVSSQPEVSLGAGARLPVGAVLSGLGGALGIP